MACPEVSVVKSFISTKIMEHPLLRTFDTASHYNDTKLAHATLDTVAWRYPENMSQNIRAKRRDLKFASTLLATPLYRHQQAERSALASLSLTRVIVTS